MSSDTQAQENKSKSSKRAKASDEDDEYKDSLLYIPKKGDAKNLMKVSVKNHPEIKKYLSMTKPELQKWLRHNAQLVTGRKHDLLLRCVDGQINGRLPACPRCHHGQFQYDYSQETYICNGFFDKLSRTPIRCGNVETEVKREPWRDLEKDSPATREESEPDEGGHGGNEAQHHKDHPDHHHEKHNCKVDANHPLVDLLEDMAYFHSVLKDENWGYRARAFKTAASAVENLDFEVKDAKALGNRGSDEHVYRVGTSSAEVMQAFLDNNKQRSPELEDLKRKVAEKEKSEKAE